MRQFLLLSLLIAAYAVVPAAAIPVRTLAFDLPASKVSFDLRLDDGKPGVIGDAKEKLQIEVCKNQFSTPVNLPPGSYVVSSTAFKNTASFTLTESEGARFLLLILPAKDGACMIFPIPDNIGKIGAGDRFLINAVSEDIGVRFGSQKVVLIKPGHSELLHPPRSATEDHRIEVEMARRVDTAWIPFNSTYWPHDQQARSFVLVHPDPVTGMPRVRNLSEIP